MNSIVRVFAIVTVCAAGIAAGADNELSEQEKADGWKLLFDGKKTTGWVNRDKDSLSGWAIEDGAFVCLGAGSGDAAYTAEQFENFVITLDWKASPKGNSGLFFRLARFEDFQTSRTEIQLLDSRYASEHPEQKAGALYMMVPPAAGADMKQDEWNNITLTCDGPKISCKLNGVESFSIDERDEKWQTVQGKIKVPLAKLPRKGMFLLQEHGGKFWFKNIKVKPLPAPEEKK